MLQEEIAKAEATAAKAEEAKTKCQPSGADKPRGPVKLPPNSFVDTMSYAELVERAARLGPIVPKAQQAKRDKGKGIAKAQPKKDSQRSKSSLQDFPPLSRSKGITIREPSSEGPSDMTRAQSNKSVSAHVQNLAPKPLDLRPEPKQAKPKVWKTSNVGNLSDTQTQLLTELWNQICNSTKDPNPVKKLEAHLKQLNGFVSKLTSDAGITGSYQIEPRKYHSQIDLDLYAADMPIESSMFEQLIVPAFYLEF